MRVPRDDDPGLSLFAIAASLAAALTIDGAVDLSGAGAIDRAGRHARLRRLRGRRHDSDAEADDDVRVHAGQWGPAGALSRTHRRVRRRAWRGQPGPTGLGASSRRRRASRAGRCRGPMAASARRRPQARAWGPMCSSAEPAAPSRLQPVSHPGTDRAQYRRRRDHGHVAAAAASTHDTNSYRR